MRNFLVLFLAACSSSVAPGMDAGRDAGRDRRDTGSETIPCGDRTCAVSEVCCVACDGEGMCGPPGTVCTGAACPEDAGPTDAGTDAGSPIDAGSGACAPGTCRLGDRPCEAPTGPTGNGCCECGGGVCTVICRCAAPTTRIATPLGERPIASLAVGDLVYSVDGDALVAVPLAAVHRAPAFDHRVVRMRLANGRTLEISPGHPTADGRFIGELAAGDRLDGVAIESAELVAFEHDATYDILPASDTASYIAEGVLVGSTLALP